MPAPKIWLDFVGIAQSFDPAIRADFESLRNSYFHWLVFSTVIVGLGLLMEAPEIWYDMSAFFRRRTLESEYFTAPVLFRKEHSAPSWVKPLAAVGWLFIIIGVVGEGIAEVAVSEADSILQSFNNTLLAEATKEAGDAKKSAENAASASSRATSSAGNARIAAETAKQKAGDVAKQADDLLTKYVEAESKIRELEKLLAPRDVGIWPDPKTGDTNIRPLMRFAGVRVVLEAINGKEQLPEEGHSSRTLE